jgi:Ni,Fe-hydrogenase I cytochrome b subunit
MLWPFLTVSLCLASMRIFNLSFQVIVLLIKRYKYSIQDNSQELYRPSMILKPINRDFWTRIRSTMKEIAILPRKPLVYLKGEEMAETAVKAPIILQPVR